MVTIRRATQADAPAVAEIFADAFTDDPVFGYFLNNAKRRPEALRKFFVWHLRHYLPHDRTFVTDDGGGAMVWVPPDQWRISFLRTLPIVPAFIRGGRLRSVPSVLGAVTFLEHLHEQRDEPHWYLPTIGVRSTAQGKGYGGALLDEMLAKVDEEGLPAYLESSTPRSRALYHRHGFEDLGETHFPSGGPPFWPMWRPAR